MNLTDPKSQSDGSDSAFDLSTATLEQFEEEMGRNQEFRNEYLDNPHDERFKRINEMAGYRQSGQEIPAELLNAKPAEENSGAAPAGGEAGAQAGPEEVDVEEYEVTIKVPKNLLVNDRNNYLANRKPDEAVIEALKGKVEADRYIQSQSQTISELSSDTVSLRTQLAEAQKRLSAVPPKIEPAGEVLEIDLDSVDPDNINLYDPEEQETALKILRAVKSGALKFPGGKEQEPPASSSGKQADTPPANSETVLKNSWTIEMAEIAELQSNRPELMTPVPFATLDVQVRDFLVDAVAKTGIKDPNYIASILRNGGEDGEMLRKKLSDQQLFIPPGFDQHQKIMQLRALRNKNRELVAQSLKATSPDITPDSLPSLPGSRYLDVYQNVTAPDPNELLMKGKKQGFAEAHRAASTEHFAKTVPPGQGQPEELTDDRMPVEQFQALMRIPAKNLTNEQAAQIVRIATRFGQMEAVDPITKEKAAKV